MKIGVGLSIPELATRGGRAFSPLSLFTSSVQGAWYDPSDYSTLFQDSAGTTPVTAVEQPVGLMLDKSQGATPGAELVTNGDFSSATGWIGSTGIISGGVASFTGSGSVVDLYQSPLTVGRWYRMIFTVSRFTAAGTFRVRLGGGGAGDINPNVTANGTYTVYGFATSAAAFNLVSYTGANFDVDNVSVKEIAGNHASQATTASRPVLRARYNLLTYSEQFTNSVWTTSATNVTATANQATAPDGTVTADLMQATAAGANSFLYINPAATNGVTYTTSIYVKRVNANWFALSNSAYFAYFNISAGTVGSVGEGSASITDVGSGWWRIVWSGQTNISNAIRVRAVTADNNPNVSGGEQYYIWGADLRTGSSAGTYQRIAAATDYATAGFLPYLALDGTDDSMATGSIDFSATDKMFVCAGLTKLNTSAAFNCLIESGVTALNGFSIFAPDSNNNNYSFWLKTQSRPVAQNYAAPITNVISVSQDTAAATVALQTKPRINGADIAQTGSTLAAATNFANEALYIGRRGGSTLPFNGRIFQMIVVGKTLSASELASTEAFVNQKTGAF